MTISNMLYSYVKCVMYESNNTLVCYVKSSFGFGYGKGAFAITLRTALEFIQDLNSFAAKLKETSVGITFTVNIILAFIK